MKLLKEKSAQLHRILELNDSISEWEQAYELREQEFVYVGSEALESMAFGEFADITSEQLQDLAKAIPPSKHWCSLHAKPAGQEVLPG